MYSLPGFWPQCLWRFWLSLGYGPSCHHNGRFPWGPKGLPMLLVPLYIVYLFLKGKHILHGLLLGLLFGTVLGLGLGLLSWSEVLSLDLDNFVAKSFIITGIDRAVGLSIFTILLMGLVATLKASGLMENLVLRAAVNAKTPKQAEGWIAGVLSVALLLTTHSIVAILMVADFTKKTGEQMEIPPFAVQTSSAFSPVSTLLYYHTLSLLS